MCMLATRVCRPCVYSLHFFQEAALLSRRFGTHVETAAIAGACLCARFEHAVNA